MKYAVTFAVKVDGDKVTDARPLRQWVANLGLDLEDGWHAVFEAIAFEAMTGGDYTEYCTGGMSVSVDPED